MNFIPLYIGVGYLIFGIVASIISLKALRKGSNGFLLHLLGPGVVGILAGLGVIITFIVEAI